MIKRVVKKLAGICLGIGAFAALFAIVLNYGVNSEAARRWIMETVNREIPGTLSFDGLSVVFYSGTLDVRNVVVNDPDGEPMIRGPHVYVNVSLISLLRKKIHLDQLIFDKPDVFLAVDEHGDLNVVRAFEKKKKKHPSESSDFPENVLLDDMQVNSGRFHFSRFVAKGKPADEIIIENISFSAKAGNLKRRSGIFSLTLGPCDFMMEDVKTHCQSLAVEGTLKKDQLFPLAVHLVSDMGTCDFKGAITSLWTSPTYDVDMALGVSLKNLDKGLFIDCGLEGDAQGVFKVQGDWNNPNIIGKARLVGGRVLGATVGDLDAEAEMHDRNITIHRLGVTAPGGHGMIKGTVRFDKAFDKGFFTSDFKEAEMAYDLTAEQVWDHPGAVPGIPKTMTGTVKSRLSLAGKGFFFDSMVAKAGLWATGTGVRFWAKQPESDYTLNVTAGMNRSKLSLSQFDFRDRKNTVTLKGIYNTSDNRWNGDLTIATENLAYLTFLTPFGKYIGKVDLQAALNGRGTWYTGDVAARAVGLNYEDINLGDISAKGILKPTGILTVTEAQLTHDGGVMNGTGDIGLFDGKYGLDLNLNFRNIDVGYVIMDQRLKGRYDGSAIVKGDVDQPWADLLIRTPGMGWGETPLGSLDAEVIWYKGLVTSRRFNVVKKESRLNITGDALIAHPVTWDLLDDPVLNLNVSGHDMRLEDYVPDLKGRFSIDSTLKGPVSRPVGSLVFDGDEVIVRGQTLKHVKLDAVLDNGRDTIRNCTLTLDPGEDIVVSGTVSPRKGSYDLVLHSDGISLKNIDRVGNHNGVAGKLILDFTGKGTFDNPMVQGTVKIADLVLNNQPVNGGYVNLVMKERNLSVSGNLIADLSAVARMDTTDFEAELQFRKTDLNPIFRIGGYEDFGGRISGKLTARGALNKPESIVARADLESLQVTEKNLVLLYGEALTLMLRNRQIVLPDSQVTLIDKGKVVIGGHVSTAGDFDFKARGNVPAGVFQAFTDQVDEMTGDMDVLLYAKGTKEHPDIHADVKLKGVGFIIPELMQTVHDLNGQMTVLSDRVTLDGLKGQLDSGTFSAKGSMALKDLKPGYLSVSVTGEAIPISVPDRMDVKVNPKITIHGTPDDTLVEGSLVIYDGKYYRNVSLNLINMVRTKSRKEEIPDKKYSEPYLRNMGLNLYLTYKTPFEVDNNIAYLQLKPDLKILGTLNSPRISGRAVVDVQNVSDDLASTDLLDLETNLIRYQGKEFIVKKGVVDFINPYRIEPVLDFECQYKSKIRDKWNVYLAITGTLENMKFSLTSDPEEQEPDILSLLVLGKTTQELINGNSDSTKSAAQILSGVISRNLGQNIKDTTGIDQFEVKYTNNSTQENTQSDVKVSFGKSLSERMIVKYGVENKEGKTIQKAESVYKFFEELSLSLSQDTENTYGAELIYRLEFR